MPSITALLDAWKRRNGVKNDSEAAKRLGVSRQAVSHWRQRGSKPDALVIVKMCAEAGIDPLAFLEAIATDRTDVSAASDQLSFPGIEPAIRAA